MPTFGLKLLRVKLLAKTMHGLEGVLSQELEALGAEYVQPGKRSVSFEGDLEVLYKANLLCRTALRILKPIHTFEARTEDMLYKQVLRYDWSQHMGVDQTLAIDAVVFSDYFTHSKYLALKTKDAIADYFRKKTGERPSVDTERPDVRINLHVSGTRCTLSLDSSGESLHKRDYRELRHKAPINEVLAAGMIMLTGWDGTTPLYDPMCGSGTIALEAAMIASNMPPGHFRTSYGFTGWSDFDFRLWQRIKNEAREAIKTPEKPVIFAADLQARNLNTARKSAVAAGFGSAIRFEQSDFLKWAPQSDGGTVIINPPYGERLDDGDVTELYEQMGTHLKHTWTGFDAWIISSNIPALKRIGLRPAAKHTLFNGKLECSYRHFELYRGSRKSGQE